MTFQIMIKTKYQSERCWHVVTIMLNKRPESPRRQMRHVIRLEHLSPLVFDFAARHGGLEDGLDQVARKQLYGVNVPGKCRNKQIS